MINKNEISIIIISITLIIPNLVYGYMDPGTWSYIIAMIVAFAAGGIFYVKNIFIQLTQFLINGIKKLIYNKNN